MNEERLKELEALCEKATEGPWTVAMGEVGDMTLSGPSSPCLMSDITYYPVVNLTDDDFNFIAEARTALPDLINRIRELERALEQAVECGELSAGGTWPKKGYEELRKWLEEKGK